MRQQVLAMFHAVQHCSENCPPVRQFLAHALFVIERDRPKRPVSLDEMLLDLERQPGSWRAASQPQKVAPTAKGGRASALEPLQQQQMVLRRNRAQGAISRADYGSVPNRSGAPD